MCISADAGDFEHGVYYSEMAHLIASELKLAGVEASGGKCWDVSSSSFKEKLKD